MTQTETTPISGLTLDSLFRENSDSISSEDDEPPLMSPDATGTTAKTDGAIHEWVAKNVVDTTSQPPVLRKTSLSLSGLSPARRLSLLERIDEDHPLSKSRDTPKRQSFEMKRSQSVGVLPVPGGPLLRVRFAQTANTNEGEQVQTARRSSTRLSSSSARLSRNLSDGDADAADWSFDGAAPPPLRRDESLVAEGLRLFGVDPAVVGGTGAEETERPFTPSPQSETAYLPVGGDSYLPVSRGQAESIVKLGLAMQQQQQQQAAAAPAAAQAQAAAVLQQEHAYDAYQQQQQQQYMAPPMMMMPMMAPPPGFNMDAYAYQQQYHQQQYQQMAAAHGYQMQPQMVMMPYAPQPHPPMPGSYVSPQMVVAPAPQYMPSMSMMSPAAALPSLDGLSQLPFMPPPAAASAPPIASRTEMGMGNGAEEPPLWGNLATLAKSAQGSRYLQAALPRMSPAELGRVRDELTPSLLELSKHTFGNYLITQLLGLPAHLGFGGALAGAIKGHVVDLVKHVHGSRVVQNALVLRGASDAVDGPLHPNPAISDEDAAALVAELDGRLLEVGLDTHGSWGVCAAFARTRAPFVLAQCAKHLGALATSQHGCRVLQRVLRLAGDSGMAEAAAVVDALCDEGTELAYLASHPYGNYVVQIALRHCGGAADGLATALRPRILTLAVCKHGSNVAEALLERATPPQLEDLCDAVFGAAPGSSKPAAPAGKEAAAAAKAGETFANGGAAAAPPQLASMMEHGYVNYVLKKLLALAPERRRAVALDAVRAATNGRNYGEKILKHFGHPLHAPLRVLA